MITKHEIAKTIREVERVTGPLCSSDRNDTIIRKDQLLVLLACAKAVEQYGVRDEEGFQITIEA